MKIDLPIVPPSDVKQGWEGQFQVFSWYNFVINVPTSVFMVTTLKENGLSNVQLNAWGMLIGSGIEPKYILQVMNNSDTLRLIKENKEFVINLPTYDLKEKFLNTSKHFEDETDEIIASGLTPEESTKVAAPRIKECYAHLECIFDWAKEVEDEVKVNTLIQGKVVSATVDDDYLLDDMRKTYGKRLIPYHFSEFYNHSSKKCTGEGGFCTLETDKRR